jgi:outer membrane protein TolC
MGRRLRCALAVTVALFAAATASARPLTLEDVLRLAERNHPGISASRARLGLAVGQLEEAISAPWFQWNVTGGGGVLPPIVGTPTYSSATQVVLNPTLESLTTPSIRLDINGNVPLYTFGKIDAAAAAARAGVRVGEWDVEKQRLSVRNDVRRAWYGVLFARDVRYVGKEILEKLDEHIERIAKKLDDGDESASEIDKLRLDVYREDIRARMSEPVKGEAMATSALRFFTGNPGELEIPDEPLKRPAKELLPVVSWLEAARLYRPDLKMAQAGLDARARLLDLSRARLLPDIGLSLSSSYAFSPAAERQRNPWVPDNFNHFFYGFALGFRWNLDLLPQAARVAQARAQLEEVESNLRLALGGVAVEVEHAHAIAVDAKMRLEAFERSERRAKQWASKIQTAVDLGTEDERMLAEPIRAYATARINRLQATYDYVVALSQLVFVSGWEPEALFQ